jgi:hypothetical protein
MGLSIATICKSFATPCRGSFSTVENARAMHRQGDARAVTELAFWDLVGA